MPELVSVQTADTAVTLSFSDYLPQEPLWPSICSSEKLWWQKSPPTLRTCSHHLRFILSLYGNWYNLAMVRGDAGLATGPDEERERENILHSMLLPGKRRRYLLLKVENFFSHCWDVLLSIIYIGEEAMTYCTHFRDLPHQRLYEAESVHMLHIFSRYLQGATCRNLH